MKKSVDVVHGSNKEFAVTKVWTHRLIPQGKACTGVPKLSVIPLGSPGDPIKMVLGLTVNKQYNLTALQLTSCRTNRTKTKIKTCLP